MLALFYSTRSKLIIGILSVALLVGAVSLIVGGRLLYNAFFNEATNRIRQDLNAARETYLTQLRIIETGLGLTVLGTGFQFSVEKEDSAELIKRLRRLARSLGLDFAGVVKNDGKLLCRIGPNPVPKGGDQIANPIANLAMERETVVAGTVVLSHEFLLAENPDLARRARVKPVSTPRAAPGSAREITQGMALACAVPIFGNGELSGVLYGGIVLNRSHEIVDKVRDTVFQQEIYNGRSIGTATIFFEDIRISTNVFTQDGDRAVGTCVSKEVREHVLEQGRKWTDRAFVVSDWYITAYEPIKDIVGERVGMLYVGVLEAKYADIRRKALTLLMGITVAGMILAVGLGFILANKIMRPVHQLIRASTEVSEGNLSPEVGPISKSEIGVLQKTFTVMLGSLRERDRRQRAESEIRLLQSEKQASIGKLAAGVAHEINNPLTGVLTYTHMLLRRKDIGDEIRSDLQAIAKATDRVRKIVKGLLDFSRQTTLDREPTEVNRLVRSAISLVENQALVKGVNLNLELGEGLPMVTVDRGQMQSVLINITINALDATEPGDDIRVSTRMGVSADKSDQRSVEIAIADSGCGIAAENLDKLFDPFFTTKEVGQGTGLGLAVSYGIVERHGGTIRVQSEPDRGSTFTIGLPLKEQ